MSMKFALLCCEIVRRWAHGARIRVNKQKQCPVVAQGEPRQLKPWSIESDEGEFVSRPITGRLKCRDFITEIGFEFGLGAEQNLPHIRVQSVRADHKVE